MALTKTPICDFGKKASGFKLKSTDNKIISLENVKGENGTLIMFICNHCPYVKAVIKEVVKDCKELEKIGIKSLAIMSNDTKNYPDDSYENMISFAKDYEFNFPYVSTINSNPERIFPDSNVKESLNSISCLLISIQAHSNVIEGII